MKRTTVHLVCNAHIDPVWLWPWTAGLDEIVSTCESICGLLERNPDVIFTRGEAWVYEQVERIAPKVFARIRRLVRRGQWEIVGGWYIQPDCNLPGVRGFERQIELGGEYFRRKFGVFPDIAYNVDSFGHAACLPGLMRAAGQRHYVMMRPEQNELALPSSLFWWRGEASGPRVLTFRIEGAYCNVEALGRAHIEMSLRTLPAGVSHTMCFIGVGDHGGGPSQEMIDWCRAHRTVFEGIELVFSSPARFFAAVARQARHAPTFTGELQPNAVGCYSVHRAVKTRARRAEDALVLAEAAVAGDARLRRDSAAELDKAWRWLCFSQFHDTLGGTATPSAYEQVDAHLGHGCAVGDEITALASRRIFAELPPDPAQRLAAHHFGTRTFDDWIEHEPWLEWTKWADDWGLADERGEPVAHQCLRGEASHGASPRLLFRLRVEQGRTREVRIVRARRPAAKTSRATPTFAPAHGGGGEAELVFRRGREEWTPPFLELIEDKTDTWSHGIVAFDGRVVDRPRWSEVRSVDAGPLMWSWTREGRVGESGLRAEWRVYAGSPYYELRLSVAWAERHRLLRLVWPQRAPIDHRLDGMQGRATRRAANGDERPLHDWTQLAGRRGKLGAVVCPDVFSLSATPEHARLTLLRSPIMAHHDPDPGEHARRVFSDQGTHAFVFRFYPQAPSTEELQASADALRRRPLVGDVTRGMPSRALRGKFIPFAP
jgi:alpha-mannosidase